LEEKRPQNSTVGRSSGGAPLTQYRLYFLHSVERLISFSHEFEADDDERAIRIAEGWREGRRAELWSGARKLKSWEADK
jgi:hypothetical protein